MHVLFYENEHTKVFVLTTKLYMDICSITDCAAISVVPSKPVIKDVLCYLGRTYIVCGSNTRKHSHKYTQTLKYTQTHT